MEYNSEKIIEILSNDDRIRDEIIYWLNDNGFLDDYKIGDNEYNDY